MTQNLGEPREAMLGRVRTALGGATKRVETGREAGPPGARAVPAPPTVDDATMRTVAPGGDLRRVYEVSATKLGLKVRRTNRDRLAADFAALLTEMHIRRAAVTIQSRELAQVVAHQLSAAEIESLPENADFHAHFDVDAGISDVSIAIAESGTLVHAAGRNRGRAPTGVPPLHIVLLPASVIVPDLLDYFATLRVLPGRDLPSSMLLISGPSKTADIEGVLVTGIHGPNEVVVLLIEDA